ncbi:cysteine synthase A [Parvivirga hydrogeniphila]|uniref:cysteine synthase A n=1 Tax=Parvivirga hydrogeniphila TaxID=2939460 RepID=UPI002B2692AE|nr:cysteine synthase A [Parvivirga hydrogeniphila]
MISVKDSVVSTIGRTPLVRLQRLADGLPAAVAVKLESRNPGGSVKDRIGWNMVRDAEERGLLRPGRSVIVEPTSGNTGIALAMVGAARGYRVVLTMPESMSVERRKLLAAYGAELVLTPRERGMAGAVEEAERIAAATPDAFLTRQFDNPANPEAHYRTTGPEIESALDGLTLGAFVAGVGTGGTITGVGRYLRDAGMGARIVAVEPAESPIIAQRLRGERETPGPHGIQGIGANFVPSVLDLGLIDSVEHVTTAEAIAMARRLAREEGLLVGISSGANVVAALRVAADPALRGTVVVTVAPSTGERYLSTPLWEGFGE